MRSIDIHAHLTPQCFWRATEGSGDWHTLRREQDARGRQYAVVGGKRQQLPPRARWTPEERLADMDSLGVWIRIPKPLFSPRAAAASPSPAARRPRAACRDTLLGAKAPGRRHQRARRRQPERRRESSRATLI
jgi:hypothetical protein